MDDLRRQSELLCEQEDLEEGRKQELQQSVRGTEEQWRTALQIVEEALEKAKTQALLEAFQAQNERVQSWIRDQEQNLQSLAGCMQVEEKPQIVQVSLKCLWISVGTLWWVVICRTSFKGLFLGQIGFLKRYLFCSGYSELQARWRFKAPGSEATMPESVRQPGLGREQEARGSGRSQMHGGAVEESPAGC